MEVQGKKVINNMQIETSQGTVYWQEDEPTNPLEGDTWFKVINGKAVNAYNRENGVWVEVEFSSQVIAEELIGKIITGAEINGSVINGGEFNNLFSENIGVDTTLKGTTTIQRGIIETNYTVNNTETDALLSSGRQTWNGVNVESVQVGADGEEAASATFGATGIDMYNKDMNSQFGRVHLDYQDLMTLPRTDIVEFNDALFTAYSGQEPAAERKMRTVQLYGACVNKHLYNPSNPTTLTWMGTLPLGYRPPEPIRFLMQGSNTSRFLLDIDSSGKIYVSRVVGWTGSKYDFIPMQAGSWFNIQCNFMAATV